MAHGRTPNTLFTKNGPWESKLCNTLFLRGITLPSHPNFSETYDGHALSLVASTSLTPNKAFLFHIQHKKPERSLKYRLRHPGCGRKVRGNSQGNPWDPWRLNQGAAPPPFDCSLAGYSNLTLNCLLVSCFHPNMTHVSFLGSSFDGSSSLLNTLRYQHKFMRPSHPLCMAAVCLHLWAIVWRVCSTTGQCYKTLTAAVGTSTTSWTGLTVGSCSGISRGNRVM